MSQYAILLVGPQQTPQMVRLSEGPHWLSVIGSDGLESRVPWWWLFRSSDGGSTDSFRRLDRRDWELRVTHGADRELLSRIGKRPLARIVHPLRRLGFLKTILGAAVLSAVIAQHFPPEWTARALSPALQHRLVDPVVAQNAPNRCSHPGGEEAIRELLVRLDPAVGRTVSVFGFNTGGFIVTAAPAGTIIVTRDAVQQTDPDVMAALLAHQLSHVRHGDAAIAMIRHEGTWGTLGALLDGRLSDGVKMEYSGLEERRADVEAMAMLRRAHISMRPAAQFFEQVRVSRLQGTYVAYDYRDFHYGIDSPAERWAEAAALQDRAGAVRPALGREDADALFNFCWGGKIPPIPPGQRRPARPASPPAIPGAGAMLH